MSTLTSFFPMAGNADDVLGQAGRGKAMAISGSPKACLRQKLRSHFDGRTTCPKHEVPLWENHVPKNDVPLGKVGHRAFPAPQCPLNVPASLRRHGTLGKAGVQTLDRWHNSFVGRLLLVMDRGPKRLTFCLIWASEMT